MSSFFIVKRILLRFHPEALQFFVHVERLNVIQVYYNFQAAKMPLQIQLNTLQKKYV